MRSAITVAAAIVTMLAGVPAALAQQSIPVTPGQGFEHAPTHFRAPAAINGIALARITEFEGAQTDISFNYDNAGTTEAVSIYVYRLASGALPVWFDRARYSIEMRTEVFGKVSTDGPVAFAPPGRTVASGLAIVYAPGKGPFLSTGMAIVPMGGWLVKIRYSSATITPGAMLGRMQAVLATLGWPGKLSEGVAAKPVVPCDSALSFGGTAKQLAPVGTDIVADAMFSVPLDDDKRAEPPASWCLDSTAVPQGAIYRANGDRGSYLIALSDNGTALSAEKGQSVGKDGQPGWIVRYTRPERIVNFLRYDRLPAPAQTFEIGQAGKYGSWIQVTATGTSVNINSDYMK